MHDRNPPYVSDTMARPLPDEELWSLHVVKAKTGLSRSTIYAYIAAGTFPPQRRLGLRRVAWLASEVKAWIVTRPTSPATRAI